MKEQVMTCDNCGKRLNEESHITIDIDLYKSGINRISDSSEGEQTVININNDEFGKYTKFINDKFRNENGNWFFEDKSNYSFQLKRFRINSSELLFCTPECLAKFFENKFSEIKLDDLGK